ncbi:CorA family divalent cation transporter [Streptomyces sp. MBT97]|uniref:CorA family divalent cation transporter n=1 Tax=Streptomyces sp. MBT97 TaxID=2800411 RepID=UPI0035AB98F9
MDPHLDRRASHRRQQGGVEVGRQDLARRTDLLRQPGHHGRPPGARLPAAPAGPDPQAFEVTEGRGVEEGGEGVEAFRSLGLPVGLHEPTNDEFAGIAELFDLHPLAVEDAVEAHQRPKVERYGETLFAVFKTVCYVEHEELTATSEVVNTGEIMVFVGQDFVITVRHGRHGSLGPLREELESDTTQLAGMNFDDMPELHWRFGYPLVIGVITVACWVLYRGFRRNGWL